MATTPEIQAALLPSAPLPSDPGAVRIVVDQLRASSVIVAALEAGAREIRPCLEPQDARALRERLGPDTLLAGERRCVRIEGFDLGNSPAEYTPARVGGRVIAYTTTNGTRALDLSRGAGRVLVGALANRRAIADAVAGAPRVALIAAGTEGQPSLEDALVVGAILDALPGVDDRPTDDAAALALLAWRSLPDHGPATIRAAFLRGRGGRNLAGRFDEDLDWCARPDTHGVVPVFDTATGIIARA